MTSLTGTWDLVTTWGSGEDSEGLIEIHPDFVSVIAERHMVLLRRGPEGWEIHHRGFAEDPEDGYEYCHDGDWVDPGRSNDIAARRVESGAFDPGELPFDVGGRWRMAGEAGYGCDLAVSADAVSLTCDRVEDCEVPWLPVLEEANARFERIRPAASIFGDLGGEWVFTSEGTEARCTLLFEGSRMRIECGGGNRYEGTLDLTFGDGVLSGRTDDGMEIAGIRR